MSNSGFPAWGTRLQAAGAHGLGRPRRFAELAQLVDEVVLVRLEPLAPGLVVGVREHRRPPPALVAERGQRVVQPLGRGATVALEALFAGPLTGASMNPARSIAPALVGGHPEHLWIYLAAPVLGALLAVPTCRALGNEEGCCAPGECGPA